MSKCANVKSAPTDICDIANTIQAQLAVKGGTIISSDDKLTILRVYWSLNVKKVDNSYTEAVKLSAAAFCSILIE